MEIWLDTFDIDAVQKAHRMGILHGVTTNPSIAARSGQSLEDLLESLLKVQSGPVTAQVVGATADEMIRQGKALHEFSDRLIIKIPVTREGLQAIYSLTQSKIPVMATAVFNQNQTLLAARAGALYIAPYYSRICEADMDGVEVFRSLVSLLQMYGFSAKVIAASLKTAEHVRECAQMGVDAVTMNEKVFQEFVQDNPLTLDTLVRFDRDWKTAPARKKLPF